MEEINAEWIRERLARKGCTQVEFGNAVGLSKQKVTKIMSGERRVQAREIPAILEFFGSDEPLSRIEPGESGPEDAQLVPVYDVMASAGYGAINHDEPQVYSLAFPPSYLKKLTAGDPRNLAIISVKGDSMEPTLHDDDIVLLDASKVDVSYDGLFVLRYDNALHVKRVTRSPRRGYVQIISDNSLYPTNEVPGAEVEAVGKVLWYGRKV